MDRVYTPTFVMVLVVVVSATTASPAQAGGILPDRENKVVIRGRFGARPPALALVFSAQPTRDAKGELIETLPEADFAALKSDNDHVVIKVRDKAPAKPGVVEYFFGQGEDAQRPWNDGREFRWEDWEKHSPDVWDNLCIVAADATPEELVVTEVAIQRGGKLLFDSAAKQSFPNKKLMTASLKPTDLKPQRGRRPVLNLSERMTRFRRDYYELGKNPILDVAYADLAQTEKRKYARRGNSWCSEFSSHVYRECGIMTPDPNQKDVHFRSMREFFEANGKVYTAREVVGWSDEKRLATIKPGTFVSLLLGDSTHSIIFATWVHERGKPVTRYTGLSGNNKGMVWPHSPMKLPSAEQLAAMSPQEAAAYDEKVYFAVPPEPARTSSDRAPTSREASR